MSSKVFSAYLATNDIESNDGSFIFVILLLEIHYYITLIKNILGNDNINS